MLFGYAQNYSDSKIKLEQEQNMYFDFIKTEFKTVQYTSNIVYVRQLGTNNLSEIKIKASKAIVKVKQKGNDNTVLINVHAKVINEKVVQIGNGNFFKD